MAGSACFSRWLAMALLATWGGAASGRAEPRQESAAQRTIRGTALIRVGESSQGTGWLFDRERRLLMTNLHVVSRFSTPSDVVAGLEPRHSVHDRVLVVFPAYNKDGTLIAERQHYTKSEADLIRSGRIVRAAVVDFDPKRDLAILRAERLPDDVLAIPLAARSQKPGESNFTIGHPGVSSLLWRNASGMAISCGFREWASQTQAGHAFQLECVALLTRSNMRHGNSGGPIVNPDGKLVGVVSGGSNQDGEALSIDLSEVREYLSEIEILVAARTAEEIQQRGRHFLDQGRIEMAASEFREVHVRRSELPDIQDDDLLDLAAVTRAQRQFEISLEWCEKALAQKKRRPGRAYAERAATRLGALPEEAFTAVDFRGPLWRSRNNPERKDPEYLKMLTQARNRHDQLWAPRRQAVLDDVAAAVREDPRSVLAYRTRAQLLSRLPSPDFPRIIDDRNTVIRLLNNAISQDAGSLLERARTYRDAKQYEMAIADCESALRVAPRSVLAHLYLATTLLAAHRPDDAFRISLKLINQRTDENNFVPLEPLNPANMELVARAALASSKHQEVVQAMNGAILRSENDMRRPARRQHYVDRADAQAALKKHDKARADYQKALKISDPKADQKPDCDEVEQYQEHYSIPVIKRKLRDLP